MNRPSRPGKPHPAVAWRSRLRKASHDAAHHPEAESGSEAVPDLPGVFRGRATLVSDENQMKQMLDALLSAGTFAFDTEFIGEASYRPQTCLVQIATSDAVWLVDPIAGFDIEPVFRLVADPAIRTLVHAGEQDLDQVYRLTGIIPENVFDTQIAAGFASMSYPASLAKLVLELSGVKLHKGFTFTDWTQRPLSAAQLRYAADDVRYLPFVACRLDEQLRESRRDDWVNEECQSRCDALRDASDPNLAWRRVRGVGNLEGRGVNVLKELVLWRDAAAREADVPPRTMVKDECLIDLAKRPPKTVDQLRNVKHLPRPVIEEHAGAIMEAAKRGMSVPVERAKDDEAEEQGLSDKFRIDAIWAKIQSACFSLGLDPAVVGSRQDAGDLLRMHDAGRPINDNALLVGWRSRAVGDAIKTALGTV
jgi:ribonuclease D